MRLHGNAALTPKQRVRLAKRVVDECWSLAAAAAEVSERRLGGDASAQDRHSCRRSPAVQVAWDIRPSARLG